MLCWSCRKLQGYCKCGKITDRAGEEALTQVTPERSGGCKALGKSTIKTLYAHKHYTLVDGVVFYGIIS